MGLINHWHQEDLDKVRRVSRMPTSAKGQSHKVISAQRDDSWDKGPRKLKLLQFKGLYILSFCGLAVAALAMLIEIVAQRLNASKLFKGNVGVGKL